MKGRLGVPLLMRAEGNGDGERGDMKRRASATSIGGAAPRVAYPRLRRPYSTPYPSSRSRTRPPAKGAPTKCLIIFPSGIFQSRGCYLVKLMSKKQTPVIITC